MQAMDRLNNTEALIDPAQIATVSRDLRELASANAANENAAFTERLDHLCTAYGFASRAMDKPFAFSDGVAVIPVHGTLLNRFNWSWSYVTGYNFIRWQLNAALDDDDVTTIVLDINSPGGEAAGCFELSKDIADARKTKPILAVVDSLAASAAYAIASAATKIFVTPSGKVGSIGVIAMHVDQSKMLEEWGLKVSLIFAGKHKADGNPYEPLPDEVRAEVQSSVDKAYGQFVELVSRNRKLDAQMIRDTEARVYRADDALAIKLVDAVKAPSEAVAAFLGEIGDDDPTANEDEDMTTATPGASTQAAAPAVIDQAALTATVAAAVSDALAADRARTNGILACDEAKGRENLAQTLASQGMGVDQAKVILAAAPKVEAKTDTKGDKDLLSDAMGQVDQPNVGADGKPTGANGGEGASHTELASQILADQRAATGRKVGVTA